MSQPPVRQRFIKRISPVLFFLLCSATSLSVGTLLFFIGGVGSTGLGASIGISVLLALLGFCCGMIGSIIILKRARRSGPLPPPLQRNEAAPATEPNGSGLATPEPPPHQSAVEPTIRQPPPIPAAIPAPAQMTPPMWSLKNLGWVCLAVIGALTTAAFGFLKAGLPLGPAELPACISTTAENLLKDMIAGSPQSKLLNIQVFAVKDSKELQWDQNSQIRHCSALVYTNAGSERISYRMYWIDREHGQLFAQTE